tara:strand:- start:30 stop:548 length:519 start_codon:yes stop_codon:yes gene_type:complete
MPIAGGAAGAAAGSLGGPATAALGAATGVTVAQMAYPSDSAPVSDAVALAAAQTGKPAPGTVASTLHETKGLVWDLGWMYLLIFVFVPLFTKKGRGWVKKFSSLHNTVSQKEIDARDEAQDIEINGIKTSLISLQKTKKEVALQNARLDNLESIIKTTPSGVQSLLTEEKKS